MHARTLVYGPKARSTTSELSSDSNFLDSKVPMSDDPCTTHDADHDRCRPRGLA